MKITGIELILTVNNTGIGKQEITTFPIAVWTDVPPNSPDVGDAFVGAIVHTDQGDIRLRREQVA
jgi:hypothetical protein